ncbi:aromatic ring-opening dioxygenase LigA [Agromyces seonyuensis]|uniref:Aromatic ring-opening dioxygenase LigA n=1 Tax=Agromyces seonyuensis TaxID=2662446 RepID=A0A6I4P320_9MICO|nr:aromatic ring-opening dioxygenase LigA [Agromyces seonyuensis]MWC00063.1 aromatic ring-opening dioxygenase LigA [Agromyces seonyuensis]
MTESFETGGPVWTKGQARIVRLSGLAGIIGGILLIVVAIVAWVMVTSQLRAEQITIPDDAMAFQGQIVDGPIDAFIQADIINHHALEMTDGKTYAQLDQDDPTRAVVMNASFLRASLFTSVISYGLAAFAAGAGVLFILFGWSMRTIVPPLPKQATA